uniref:Uncharacterized protein n=1 Tax=Knipowitschia caucasica TaxID=637954 RepID=A0AAV2K3P6_KNICA
MKAPHDSPLPPRRALTLGDLHLHQPPVKSAVPRSRAPRSSVLLCSSAPLLHPEILCARGGTLGPALINAPPEPLLQTQHNQTEAKNLQHRSCNAST